MLLQASPSPQWWLTGWVLSIGLLIAGYVIAAKYYDGRPGGEAE